MKNFICISFGSLNVSIQMTTSECPECSVVYHKIRRIYTKNIMIEFVITYTLFIVILCLCLLYLCIHYSHQGRLINKIHGPPHLPFIGNLADGILSVEKQWALFNQWSHKYYPIFKFWLGHKPTVYIQDPHDIEVILSNQKNIAKGWFYDFLHSWLGTGLLTSTGEKWRMRRKILTPAFHFKILQEFTNIFVEYSQELVNSMKNEGDDSTKDLVPFFANYTLKIICKTILGTTLRSGNALQDEYREIVEKVGDVAFYRYVRPWLKNDFIFSLTSKGREYKEMLKILHRFTLKLIKERKEYHEATGGIHLKIFSSNNEETINENDTNYASHKKKKLAMLDLLISMQRDHNDIDDEGIREEVDTFVFEGHDTTTVALCYICLLLAENKEIQKHARAEIDEVMTKCDEKLGMKELQNLQYLERCIKESLRLFPPVPTTGRNIIEEIKFGNYIIPIGTLVGVQIYEVHRDPKFWPNPEVYDPDRFLPDQIKGRHPYSYIPFSAGPRNCIGQKFVMLELKTTLAYMLHNFYMEPITESGKVPFSIDVVLKSMVPLYVKFVPIHR